MAHQVLARKWRPQFFDELAGQSHVVQALTNALEQQRLHHAYLFSGTRGIGKTTIARILARCLNCEQGVTARPCGSCASCVEISEGRSMDLIEVDAASRTKVDDTRELLENVQFAPSRSRYKIYLIDEVHMLSNSSFNALLKTIEEPPGHVIFLFATTHPQKMPATVLSRCLQFHLKNMTVESIVEHLQQVLGQESVNSDIDALQLIGKAAAGSMRDALSLTEQAIAFGGGKVEFQQVQEMLGVVNASIVADLLQALVDGEAQQALQLVRDYASQAVDFALLVDELLSALHRIAVEQAVPEAGSAGQPGADWIPSFAAKLSAEDVQLYYQTALLAKRDLPLAPDPLTGLEMMVLRLYAFRQMVADDLQGASLAVVNPEGEKPRVKKPEPSPAGGERQQAVAHQQEVVQQQAVAEQPAEKQPAASQATGKLLMPDDATGSEALPLEELNASNWCQLFSGLPLSGVVRAVASHCLPLAVSGDSVKFALLNENAMLFKPESADRLASGLSIYFGRPLKCQIELVDSWAAAGIVAEAGVEGAEEIETPVMYRARLVGERREQAIQELRDDSDVQALLTTFDASLDEQSIEFIDSGQ